MVSITKETLKEIGLRTLQVLLLLVLTPVMLLTTICIGVHALLLCFLLCLIEFTLHQEWPWRETWHSI